MTDADVHRDYPLGTCYRYCYRSAADGSWIWQTQPGNNERGWPPNSAGWCGSQPFRPMRGPPVIIVPNPETGALGLKAAVTILAQAVQSSEADLANEAEVALYLNPAGQAPRNAPAPAPADDTAIRTSLIDWD